MDTKYKYMRWEINSIQNKPLIKKQTLLLVNDIKTLKSNLEIKYYFVNYTTNAIQSECYAKTPNKAIAIMLNNLHKQNYSITQIR